MKHLPESLRSVITRLLAITIGAGIIGFGLNFFNIANHLAEGGLAGLAILIKFGVDINPGSTLLIMNIPLLIWGTIELGGRQTVYTVYGTGALVLALWIFDSMRMPLGDPLLAALYAGVCMGLGLGLVFRFGGTTGGADILARIANKRFGWSIGSTLFGADIFVLALSLVYLNLQQAMYTLVAVFIGTRVVDLVQQGAYRAKALMVISNAENEISRAVIDELNRGVTILKGVGGYTGHQREILYVVCARSELVRIKRLIESVDPMAFVTVTDVHEVIGEGFSRRSPAVSQTA